jgi:hypothetical protein
MSEPESAGHQPFPAFATATVDESSFDGYASVLDGFRDRPDSEPLTRAVEVATRAAAIDTGAIEGLYEVDRGFTMTVARGVAAWEKVLAAREPVVRRSFEDALGGVVMAGIQARGILTYSTIDAAGGNADRVEPAFRLVSSDATPMPVELRDILPVLSSCSG